MMDEIVVGKDMPEESRNKEMIEFSNYPRDERSKYILRLIGLHLPRFNDEQKDQVIKCLQGILGINV